VSRELPDRATLERALREAFEAALPSIVSRALGGGESTPVAPAPRRRAANLAALTPLFDAARSGGEPAVRSVLGLSLEHIRGIATALDRTLGERLRRTKDAQRAQDDVAAEVMRRALRNDVFLGVSERSGDPDPEPSAAVSPAPPSAETDEDAQLAAIRERLWDLLAEGGHRFKFVHPPILSIRGKPCQFVTSDGAHGNIADVTDTAVRIDMDGTADPRLVLELPAPPPIVVPYPGMMSAQLSAGFRLLVPLRMVRSAWRDESRSKLINLELRAYVIHSGRDWELTGKT
jgi:hypothetical protein